jgi:hypothetical protein
LRCRVDAIKRTQLVVLVLFVLFGIIAVRRFRRVVFDFKRLRRSPQPVV